METKVADNKRRNFLKVLGFGGGALVLGKIFSGSLMDLIYGPTTTKEFSQFNVTENKRKFAISTKDGQEIFIMDNEK